MAEHQPPVSGKVERKKGRGWLWFLLLLVLLLAGLNGYVYMNYQKAQQEITALNSQIDTLELIEQRLEQQIQQYQDSIQQLTLRLEEAQAEREELLAEIKRLEKEARAADWLRRQVRKLKKELAKYQESGPPTEGEKGVDYAKYMQLQEEYKRLKAEYMALQQQLQAKVDSIAQLQGRVKELEEAMSGFLVAKNIDITPIRVKKGEEVPTTKAKKVSAIRLCFSLAENPYLKEDKLKLLVRIIDPEGVTLYKESAGSGRFTTPEGREKPYTFDMEVVYPPVTPQTCVYWEPFMPLNKGTYRVEIYYRGNMIGGAKFSLR